MHLTYKLGSIAWDLTYNRRADYLRILPIVDESTGCHQKPVYLSNSSCIINEGSPDEIVCTPASETNNKYKPIQSLYREADIQWS